MRKFVICFFFTVLCMGAVAQQTQGPTTIQGNLAVTSGPSSFAILQTQVTACGSNACTIFIGGNVAITSNYAIPANITLNFSGGQLQPSTSITLTVSGTIVAPASQIFGGAGTISGLLVARPEWLGTATIAQTVATLSTSGGTVLLSNAVYRSGYEGGAATLSLPNIAIIGIRRPSYNTGFTALVNGSIIQGTFNAVAGANNLVIKNVGFDMGSAFVNASLGGVASDTFSIDVPGQALGTPAVSGVVLDNINCLNYSATALFHCMLVENVSGASIHNTQSVYGLHGAVLKGTNSTWDGHYGRGHSYDTMIIKGDDYAPSINDTVSNIRGNYLATVGDTGGLVLQAGLAQNLNFITVANVAMNGTSSGIDFTTSAGSGLVTDIALTNLTFNAISGACIQGNGLSSLPFSNISISNATCSGSGQPINIAGNLNHSSISNFSSYSSGLGAILSGSKITLSNINFFSVAAGAAVTSSCAGCTAVVSNLQTDDATRVSATGGATILDADMLLSTALQPGAVPVMNYCGTAAACSPSLISQPLKQYYGSAPLTSGTPSLVSINSLGFTSATSYSCWALDSTAVSALKIAYLNGTGFQIIGPATVTDTVQWGCFGY